MGLSGKFGSNGFTYAMPLPVIVCLGVNDVLFGHIIPKDSQNWQRILVLQS